MKHLMIATIVLTTALTAAQAYAGGQKYQCKYRDLYSAECEKDLVRFLQRLDLTTAQKTAIDRIYSTVEQRRNAELAKNVGRPQGVVNLNPADPDYNKRAAQLAEQKAARVEQITIDYAAVQAQVYGLLTPAQQAAYEQLRNDWVQGRFEKRQRHPRSNRSSPTARNWASTSITF